MMTSQLTTDHGPRSLGSSRPGVTLTEVLVAIFIMGIGMISLLVLFPLGAMKASLAIKDERTAHSAANADAIARMFDLMNDPAVYPNYTQQAGLPPLAGNGPSYPVYIDPLGVSLGSTRIGGSPGFARVAPQKIPLAGPNGFRRWFALLDDINFTDDGLPKATGGFLERDRRYSWAYLCRQVKATMPTGTPPYKTPDGVDLTVVVYDRRPAISAGATLPTETVYQAVFTRGSPVVTVSYSGTQPNIAKGTWILDATVVGSINGYFYRVASVANGSGMLTLSLTQPARASGNVCVVMENVVEVFEKGVR